MANLRRVSELDQSDVVTRAFTGNQESFSEDRYAALRASQNSRQQRIAQNSVESSRQSAQSNQIDWSAGNQPTMYNNGHTLSDPYDYAGQKGNGIRRVDSGDTTDQGYLSPEELNRICYVTESDARRMSMDMFNGNHSIWGGNFQDVAVTLDNLAKDSGLFDQENEEDRRARAATAWATQKGIEYQREIAHTRVSSRAPKVVRNGLDYLTASSFGQVDYTEIDRREQARADSLLEKMERSRTIKSHHIISDQERRAQWESEAGHRTGRVQDHQSSWADKFAEEYGS